MVTMGGTSTITTKMPCTSICIALYSTSISLRTVLHSIYRSGRDVLSGGWDNAQAGANTGG